MLGLIHLGTYWTQSFTIVISKMKTKILSTVSTMYNKTLIPIVPNINIARKSYRRFPSWHHLTCPYLKPINETLINVNTWLSSHYCPGDMYYTTCLLNINVITRYKLLRNKRKPIPVHSAACADQTARWHFQG